MRRLGVVYATGVDFYAQAGFSPSDADRLARVAEICIQDRQRRTADGLGGHREKNDTPK